MTPTHLRPAATLTLALGLAVGACGGPRTPPVDEPLGPTGPSDATEPAPSELERRKAAACETLGPRLTECSVADAKATLSPEKLAELDLERTSPVHTKKFIAECTASRLSSRQVRVLEVCQREEQQCEPLVACLDHLAPEGQGEATSPSAAE